ncbi:MAG: cytochrome b/b6 domain-containing protein [Burkholderiaceae bacterium]
MHHTPLPALRVWDLPTRIFHWTLSVCVIGLFISAKMGGAAMAWHFYLGYSVLTLLLFRLLWGVFGGYWSRFSTFLYSPLTLLRFLQGQRRPEYQVGHSPLGALSVWALLGFLAVQVGTGLVSDDEIANSGPLSRFVSNAVVNLATWYHKEAGQFILLGLVLLHLLAVTFYTLKKRQKLVASMIHGHKQVSVKLPASRDDTASRLLSVFLLLSCAALVFWLIKKVS